MLKFVIRTFVSSIDNFRDLSEILRNHDYDLRTVNPVPSVQDFIKLVNTKTKEESVFVRRNALQVCIHAFLGASELGLE